MSYNRKFLPVGVSVTHLITKSLMINHLYELQHTQNLAHFAQSLDIQMLKSF